MTRYLSRKYELYDCAIVLLASNEVKNSISFVMLGEQADNQWLQHDTSCTVNAIGLEKGQKPGGIVVERVCYVEQRYDQR
jgi:hypothetical protein